MTPNTKSIEQTLEAIERNNNIRVLLAVLTGSRAYGWNTPNSDTDIGFVFTHPVDHYLRLQPNEDVITTRRAPTQEDPQEYWFHGWDMRHLLFLVAKSNVRALEWVHGSIRYRDHAAGLNDLREYSERNWSPQQVGLSEHRFALSNYNEHLRRKRVKATRYLPVIRALLRLAWIEERDVQPPSHIITLTDQLATSDEKKVIYAAITSKRNGETTRNDERNEALDAIIVERLQSAYLSESNDKWALGPSLRLDDLDRLWRIAVMTPEKRRQ